MERCSATSILLVDREPAFRGALAGMLREDGHHVVEAADAADAACIEAFDAIHVLLCAHDVPAENGIWLADRFHAVQPTLPVVLLAAYRPRSLGRDLAHRRHVGVLQKPMPYDLLHRLIHKLTSGSRAVAVPPAPHRGDRHVRRASNGVHDEPRGRADRATVRVHAARERLEQAMASHGYAERAEAARDGATDARQAASGASSAVATARQAANSAREAARVARRRLRRTD